MARHIPFEEMSEALSKGAAESLQDQREQLQGEVERMDKLIELVRSGGPIGSLFGNTLGEHREALREYGPHLSSITAVKVEMVKEVGLEYADKSWVFMDTHGREKVSEIFLKALQENAGLLTVTPSDQDKSGDTVGGLTAFEDQNRVFADLWRSTAAAIDDQIAIDLAPYRESISHP